MSSDTSNTQKRNSKKLFIISPIGDPETSIRKRSDLVKRHIIDPTAEKKGYMSIRSDVISQPGRIEL